MGCLYRITFPSGKSYIGITAKTTDKRFAAHFYDSRRSDNDRALQRAIRKYGRHSAVVETLVVAEWDYLLDLERRAIKAFGTKVPHGYNVSEGGDGVLGAVRSMETRLAMSIMMTGRTKTAEHRQNLSIAKKGKALTQEHKDAIRNGMMGRPTSPGTRAKLSAAKLGIKKSEETKQKLRAVNLGKTMTEEARGKISVALRGRPWSDKRRAAQEKKR